MEETDLGQRILKYLSSRPKNQEALNKMVQALKVQKKSLNSSLYKLQKQSLLVKLQDSPPLWGLSSHHSICSTPNQVGRATRSRGKKTATDGTENSEIFNKILKFMNSKRSPRKTIDIAKSIGLSRTTEVNPHLYSMEKKGLIEKKSGKPVTWALVAETEGFDFPQKDVYITEAGSSSSLPTNTINFMEFQDTNLFPVNSDLDSSQTDLLTDGEESDDLGLTDDHDFNDQKPGLSDEMLDGFESPVNENLETENVISKHDSPIKTEEIDESVLIKTEKPDESVPFLNENALCQNEQIVNTEMESVAIEKGNESSLIENESESRLLGERGIKRQPLIQSADEVSDNCNENVVVGEQSVDALNEIEQDADKLTPADMQRSITPPAIVHTTPVIVSDVLDMEAEGLGSPVIATEAGDSQEVKTEDLKAESDTKMEDLAANDMKMDDQSVSDTNCTNDEEIHVTYDAFSTEPSSPEHNNVDTVDMENGEKILRVLSSLPGVAQFVLMNKTKLTKEELEKALDKCKSLGLISGCTKLWKITPEGIDYIEDKIELNKEPKIKVTQPVQQKKFTGPPPSPMALLKKGGNLPEGQGHVRESQTFQSKLIRDRSPLQSSQSKNASQVKTTYAYTHRNKESDNLESLFSISSNQIKQSEHSSQSESTIYGGYSQQGLRSQGGSSENDIGVTSYGTSQMKNRLAQPQTTGSSHNGRYADYPNKSTSSNVLQSLSKQTGSSKTGTETSQTGSKFFIPPNPMELLSKNLKKTEISPPNTPLSSPNSKEPISATCNTVSYQSFKALHGFSIQNQSDKFVTPKPPHLLSTGPSSLRLMPQAGNQPVSLLSTNQRQTLSQQSTNQMQGHSLAHQSMNLSSRNEFKSLPVSLNKTSGHASMNGLGSLALSNESFNALNKNPVSALMEYAQSRKMVARIEVTGRSGPPHRPTFTMAVFMGSRQFPSITCNNKKDGRQEACDIALRQLIAEGQFQAEKASHTEGPKPQASLETMTHFDKMAALTHRGFTALVSQITAESFAGRKVIAGLVMKRSDEDTGILISLGTGNRCITGQQLSLQGNTVNDSHAEIITRRGFIRFLYKQLLDYDPSKSNPLFEKSRSGKLQIRPKITFHLYISTAPCGDGALFSPRDAESSKTPVDTRVRPPHEPIFSNNVQGLLRTKVEGGEGTIPIEPGFKGQTFDGIQRGERLRTMSCTDKVCRWNVVGMQGALLSHFIEPVYLDSLTLGLLYDHGHLSRAVCCRVGRGDSNIQASLPPNYRLNHPWLGRVTVCDPPREVQKTKALSVNWCFGDSAPEVTDGTLGLCNTSIEKNLFSRCTKRNLFTSFKAVCEKFGRSDLLQAQSYKDVKMMATDFQQAREAMLKKFKENKYGPWVSKPVEEEMFGWDE